MNRGCGVRTHACRNIEDLKSSPLDHSGNPPLYIYYKVILISFYI